ncbi:MAG: hypothetical protein KKI02_01960, partial [Planctomycetes bacterium]|nr:hypothetical protein [Planctomycetota bacterium]
MLLATAVVVATAWIAPAQGDTRLRSGNLLVVAASGYVGSAPLDEYVATKTAQGLNVMVYNVPSGTNRTVIKDYIVDLWGSADAPDYVLLVGDTSGSSSTTTTIPHWIGGGSKAADTDWPYVCMPGGIDWY